MTAEEELERALEQNAALVTENMQMKAELEAMDEIVKIIARNYVDVLGDLYKRSEMKMPLLEATLDLYETIAKEGLL